MRKLITLLSIGCASMAFSQSGQDETLTNQSILNLKKEGVSKAIIINSIEEAEDFNFDISSKGLGFLSKNKVDDDIVMAILKKQKNKASSTEKVGNASFNLKQFGLFISEGDSFKQIPSHLTQINMKPQGMGMSMKMTGTIPNPKADVTIPSGTDTFYFNMNTSDKETTNAVYNITNSIDDPNQGELVKLEEKKKLRQIQVGSASAFSGISNGVKSADRIEYTVTRIKNNFYKLITNKPLPKGEYGFIFGAINGGTSLKIYDFSVE